MILFMLVFIILEFILWTPIFSYILLTTAHYEGSFFQKIFQKDNQAEYSWKKFMLCIWWDQLGVVYYELLKPNETITGALYRTQLMRLSRALKEKRAYYSRHDKIILLHDNIRPHVATPIKTYLETLKWEVLPHPPYYPDIAPSKYHLFQSMTHGLSEQHFII